MDFAKPESTPHDASFRGPLHQVKKAAEIVRFTDRADMSPDGCADLRVIEALLVEYLAWVPEGDAELSQMPSEIFVDEMSATNVFALRGSHLPVTPDMIPRMPPFVLFCVVHEP